MQRKKTYLVNHISKSQIASHVIFKKSQSIVPSRHLQLAKASTSRHGNRYRENVHSVSDYLASLEGSTGEASVVSR